METLWEQAAESLAKVKVNSNVNNEPVTISEVPSTLNCVGLGTDAAVFQHKEVPNYVYKLFADEKKHKVEIEKEVYEKLGPSEYFPTFYAAMDHCLVLSHEEGKTLYDCIVEGIHIPEQVVLDVERAREHVRQRGLNPRDIHLKNIILQNGRGKIIDVSEYVKPGNDFRWEHLKKGYEEYYHFFDGKPVPLWIVETVRKAYNQWNKHFS
ncbi:serine/threonine protein kinase [Mangrovibacillus cuniculi]|uniref:Serine/threonine protein kinase n=1 Tax=Mangrovibacillus cuniculi TaxID=2593652 RepID=A0A7S8C9A0_9BACI|nr:serine/threonine protein kinase [Mangrovibacillus cuniculi]QPC45641.1 serine/threonine protein kinase [Mangrovibacillus cuniculi]